MQFRIAPIHPFIPLRTAVNIFDTTLSYSPETEVHTRPSFKLSIQSHVCPPLRISLYRARKAFDEVNHRIGVNIRSACKR